MKTTNDLGSVTSPVPRLPAEPATGLEGWVHLVLGAAAAAMVWLLLASIQDFVPRAGTFAERLREAPVLLVAPSYALRSTATNGGAATVANAAAASAKPVTNEPPRTGEGWPAS
jgi:hypothetical protein